MGITRIQGHLLIIFLVLIAYPLCIYASTFPRDYGRNKIDRTSEPLSPTFATNVFNRSSFPPGFIFGAASSAYQIEGAWNESGKGPSVWDEFSHKYPGKIADSSNGDVACDSFHKYKDDIELVKEMNMDAYRLSIAWTRILPNGKLSGGVNQKGIDYYNKVINTLLANGITPYVTLFHWDTPQALEEEYGGFRSSKIIDDYVDFAEVCFKAFGDRVKFWSTFNEPYSYSVLGYDSGMFAPGRCSSWLPSNCNGGNSSVEPYLVTHYQILSHAAAVKLYKNKYQASQKGKIGIVLVTQWTVPLTNSSADRRASLRSLDFMFGWYMNPIIFGDYPPIMKRLVKGRLPVFTEEESALVKGSYDFIGVNYYTASYTTPMPAANGAQLMYSTDSLVNTTSYRNGTPIGEQAGSDWLYVYPRGIWDLLIYIKNKYNNPLLYITENGVDEVNDESLPLETALVDNFRIKFYLRHLYFLHQAIKHGVNLKGYFAWSIMDNYEWNAGYTVRFGLNYVDFKDGQKRYQKLSSKWVSNFLKR